MVRRLLLCSAMLASVVALPTTSATAGDTAAPTGSYVTMVSEAHASVGQGAARLWRAGPEAMAFRLDANQVTVSANGAPGWADLTFAAPPGQTLAPGRYDSVAQYPYQGPGLAGMQVASDGFGCAGATGSFTVHELQPELGRLWVTYVQYCDGMRPGAFGEIRIGMPPLAPGTQVMPTRVSWPSEYPTVAVRPVPVIVRNSGTSPLTVGTVRIAAGNSDFSVLDNGCSTIQPGGQCTVHVGFTPSVPGNRVGDLRIGSLDVPLAGNGTDGEAYQNMTSDVGDVVGAGQSYAYSPETGTPISASGDQTRVHFVVPADADTYWFADFVAPSGETLTPGTTYGNTQWYPGGDAAQPGLDVWSPATSSCGTATGEFTVSEAAYDTSGTMTSFKASFVQHCNGAEPALRGTLAFQAPVPSPPPRDTTAPQAPTRVAASFAGRSVHLSWTNPSADWAVTEVRGIPGTVTPGPGVGSDISTGRGGSADYVLPATGTGYRIALVARDAAGNASTPARVSVSGSQITLTTQPAHLVAGKTGVLSGRLISTSGAALPGKRVDLSRTTAGGTWATFAHLTTTSTGAFHRTVAPSLNTQYRATFPGVAGRLGSQSSVATLSVAPAMSLAVNRVTGPPYAQFDFTTTVSPAHAGALVYLQRHRATGWANALQTRLGPHGWAKATLHPARGTYTYRWFLPAGAGNTAGASRAQKITVR